QIATLDFSYWNNPALLINNNDGQHVIVPTPLTSSAAFTFGDAGNVLTFNSDGSLAANYFVSVTAADSLSSTTHSFELSLTDAAPTFTVSTPGATTISHKGSYDATVSGISDGDVALGGVAEVPAFSANV